MGEDAGSLLYEAQTCRIRGAAFEVCRVVGQGFLEAAYQECLSMEFGAKGTPFIPTPRLELNYKGSRLRQTYSPDFICDAIVVEIKALAGLTSEATGLRLGLLINFGPGPKTQIERFAL